MIKAAHRVIFSRSLVTLSKTLHRDMCCLKAPWVCTDNVKLPMPDPLAASCYPCIYWIDHLCKLAPGSYDDTINLWDANSNACLQTFTEHSSLVRAVAFSHDLTKLASASARIRLATENGFMKPYME